MRKSVAIKIQSALKVADKLSQKLIASFRSKGIKASRVSAKANMIKARKLLAMTRKIELALHKSFNTRSQFVALSNSKSVVSLLNKSALISARARLLAKVASEDLEDKESVNADSFETPSLLEADDSADEIQARKRAMLRAKARAKARKRASEGEELVDELETIEDSLETIENEILSDDSADEIQARKRAMLRAKARAKARKRASEGEELVDELETIEDSLETIENEILSDDSADEIQARKRAKNIRAKSVTASRGVLGGIVNWKNAFRK